ncbi:MAG: single-stranded DNA-binding protein [Selenomonadaceae bacterium]|nr:single-stranded DNA-binding protein [Selenomonadaceae bacterium]
MNKVFLSGNLTQAPEVRYTQSGKAFTRMGIAINRRYKDKEQTDFFNLIAWEKTAEFCSRYLNKGSRVLVEGRLQTYSYEGQDGTKRSGIDVIVDNIEFADSKRANSGNDNSAPSDNSYQERRQPAPPKKNNYNDDFGGEPIDPEDTPF